MNQPCHATTKAGTACQMPSWRKVGGYWFCTHHDPNHSNRPGVKSSMAARSRLVARSDKPHRPHSPERRAKISAAMLALRGKQPSSNGDFRSALVGLIRTEVAKALHDALA